MSNNSFSSPIKINSIPIKNIERKGKIVSYTKIIIDYPKNGAKKNNYNTFCTFKSIDDIFYLVYIKEECFIVFYNLIDEKKVIDIDTKNDPIVEIKYLFVENNERDLLLSLSKNNFKLWNINNFECLFDIKWKMKFIKLGLNHFGILKSNNKNYNIIVANKYEPMKIFDLNGNQLYDNYEYILKSALKNEDLYNFTYIDTYYDKKLYKSYILFNDDYNKLYSFDYQKGELYQKYGAMYYYNEIIVNDEDENIIKVMYFINYDSIAIFNFHSGMLIYKINFKIKPYEKFKNNYCSYYDTIYSINYWNNNYISLSYGEIFEAGYTVGNGSVRHRYSKRYHSIEIIDLKEEKMKEVLKSTTIDKVIFVKKIFHPKYGDCLLAQDDCGEIIIIQIKLA